MYPAGNLLIPVEHGQLEAILKEPRQGPPRAAALVLHPHPLGGGTMHNKVAPPLHCRMRASLRSESIFVGSDKVVGNTMRAAANRTTFLPESITSRASILSCPWLCVVFRSVHASVWTSASKTTAFNI